jgi:nitrogen fixation protein NifU and related proteins
MAPDHDKLQELILLADARKGYSQTAINHLMHPRNFGVLPDDDSFARTTVPCGDTMEIWIRVRQGTITKAHFMTKGFGASIASGSVVTALAIGKTLAEAGEISQQDILTALGGLPEEIQHCALLATNTLKAAICDFSSRPREPWNTAYHKKY